MNLSLAHFTLGDMLDSNFFSLSSGVNQFPKDHA
jgi:hypothetical protein